MSDLSYCAEQVRDFDNDRFIATLFAEPDKREHLFALYAFNLELAKIRESVSEPMIGRMRLQFWRDALPGIIEGKPPKHAVAEPLSKAVHACGLPLEQLLALVDAREADLDAQPPADLQGVIGYAEQTSSRLVSLAFQALGIAPSEYESFVRNAGICIGLVGLVRAIPYQASTGRVTLPGDLCHQAGLDPSSPHQWPKNPDVSAITLPMLAKAREHLLEARRMNVPKAVLPAALPLSLASLYLTRLEKLRGDPKAFNERPPAVARHLTLLWRSMIGRV